MFTLTTATDFAAPAPPIRWMVRQFLHPGLVTLFTSPWKSGKTTFLSVLLARAGRGEGFLGEPLSVGRTIIVSEESAEVWHGRARRLGLGDRVAWCLRPFRGPPSPTEWSALVDYLATQNADLIVIDPLAMFLPATAENAAGAMLTLLQPLHRLTTAGAAVLLVHHPRKALKGEPSPRGSGALGGFADVLATLDHPPGSGERQRCLTTNSRLTGRMVRWIELNAAEDDYSVVAPAAVADDFQAGGRVLRTVLEDACERLSRLGIHRQWPADHEKPSLATLSRWLEQGQVAGWVCRKGRGRCKDPYRYWLKGKRNLLPDLPPLAPLETLHRAKRIRKADRIAAEMQNDFAKGAGRTEVDENEEDWDENEEDWDDEDEDEES